MHVALSVDRQPFDPFSISVGQQACFSLSQKVYWKARRRKSIA